MILFGFLSGLGLLALLLIAFVFTVIEVALYQYDRYGWCTVVMGVGIIGAWLGLDEFREYVTSAPWQHIASQIAIYLGIGIGVAFAKWVQFNVKFASALSEVKAGFKDFDSTNTEHLVALFKKIKNEIGEEAIIARADLSYVDIDGIKSMDNLIDAVTPKAKKSVDRISAWIATWPFVIVHTIFADFIIKLGKHIATIFDSVFGKMTRAIVANGLK